MPAPTREEYGNALKRAAYLGDAIIRERKLREDLINKLCDSQKCLMLYESALNDVKEIIQKYEIYEELKTKN